MTKKGYQKFLLVGLSGGDRNFLKGGIWVARAALLLGTPLHQPITTWLLNEVVHNVGQKKG